jgi:hypothetical protein
MFVDCIILRRRTRREKFRPRWTRRLYGQPSSLMISERLRAMRSGNIIESGPDRYTEGFLAGRAIAYCERVNTGAGLAAQMSFPKEYTDKLVQPVAQEGCESAVEQLSSERDLLWIYRDELAKRLIDQARSDSEKTSELDMWRMGKLFGYSDHDVLAFIERSTLAFPEESGPPPSADMLCSHMATPVRHFMNRCQGEENSKDPTTLRRDAPCANKSANFVS